MTRLTMVLTAFLCCLPSAMATYSPQKNLPALGRQSLPTLARDLPPDLDKPASAPEAKPEKQDFVITDETEVKLDGQVCKFQDVPGSATIVTLNVAADKKTILKIYFRSKK